MLSSQPACYNELAAMNLIARFSLVRLLLAGGAVILLAGMLVVGTWVGREIERGVISRAGMVTSLYVDSLVSAHLQSLASNRELREADRAALDRLLSGTPLGQHTRFGPSAHEAARMTAMADLTQIKLGKFCREVSCPYVPLRGPWDCGRRI